MINFGNLPIAPRIAVIAEHIDTILTFMSDDERSDFGIHACLLRFGSDKGVHFLTRE